MDFYAVTSNLISHPLLGSICISRLYLRWAEFDADEFNGIVDGKWSGGKGILQS